MQDKKPGSPLPVRYIGWGIADNVEGTIYLHKALKRPEWRSLHDKLLRHEQAHSGGGYGWVDFLNDLKPSGVDMSVVIFLGQNPSGWAQFSPFRLYPGKRKLYYDPFYLLLYGLIAATALAGWLLL